MRYINGLLSPPRVTRKNPPHRHLVTWLQAMIAMMIAMMIGTLHLCLFLLSFLIHSVYKDGNDYDDDHIELYRYVI